MPDAATAITFRYSTTVRNILPRSWLPGPSLGGVSFRSSGRSSPSPRATALFDLFSRRSFGFKVPVVCATEPRHITGFLALCLCLLYIVHSVWFVLSESILFVCDPTATTDPQSSRGRRSSDHRVENRYGRPDRPHRGYYSCFWRTLPSTMTHGGCTTSWNIRDFTTGKTASV